MSRIVHAMTRSWWFVTPPAILLALMHVGSATGGRYASGQTPDPFGISWSGHFEDAPIALLVMLVLLAAACWLAIAAPVACYHSFTHRRPPLTMAWQMLAVAGALVLPLVPSAWWDELLVHTVGPGQAAGELLSEAIARDDIERLRYLLGNKIPDNAWDRALTTAIAHRQNTMAGLLLEKGADPNRTDKSLAIYTPLRFAIEVGDARIVRTLLNAGADGCARTRRNNGLTFEQVSLHSIAQRKGYTDIVALLPACPSPGQ